MTPACPQCKCDKIAKQKSEIMSPEVQILRVCTPGVSQASGSV